MSLKRLAVAIPSALTFLAYAASAAAVENIGQPTNGAIDMQPGVTPLREQAIDFHTWVLMPIITAICLLVLGLLIWIVVRFNAKRNPVPARWSHNTAIEIAWTVVPVLILAFIAVFSFRLLFAYHNMPQPYMTVKATGYQWYWGYEYPDNGVSEMTSNMLTEAEVAQRGLPHSLYRFASNQPLVVPVNRAVRVLVTGSDVIHAFAVPAFGIIADAVPGRVNETWFNAERVGTYYGQCRELCGVDHAFMPIEVRVVPQAEFDAWVAQHNGHRVGQAPAPAAAAVSGPTTPPTTAAAPAAPVQSTAPTRPSGTAAEATAPVAGPPANSAAGSGPPGPAAPTPAPAAAPTPAGPTPAAPTPAAAPAAGAARPAR